MIKMICNFLTPKPKGTDDIKIEKCEYQPIDYNDYKQHMQDVHKIEMKRNKK